MNTAPSPDPSPSGEGDTPKTHPSRRLRHLDPSHSEILGTRLTQWNVVTKETCCIALSDVLLKYSEIKTCSNVTSVGAA